MAELGSWTESLWVQLLKSRPYILASRKNHFDWDAIATQNSASHGEKRQHQC